MSIIPPHTQFGNFLYNIYMSLYEYLYYSSTYTHTVCQFGAFQAFQLSRLSISFPALEKIILLFFNNPIIRGISISILGIRGCLSSPQPGKYVNHSLKNPHNASILLLGPTQLL